MFAKTIVTSDAFLDMPHSARCLYFTLNLFADDDGFVNSPKSIMRQTGATVDDMNLLITKKFVLVFDSGVIVIKHWRIHNYIRGDRKHDTKYAEEMALLTTDEKGAYTLGEPTPQLESPDDEPEMTLRQRAYKESELPYSFDYKIRKAFYGKPCPMCGALMKTEVEDGIVTKHHLPTIQHNLPIAKGGRHELGNISVICHACNVSTKDNPTEDLNADEVVEVWEDICQTNGRQMAGKCHTEDRLGKDSIGKNSIDKDSINVREIRGEFESLWKLYPRKQGKDRAYKAYEKARKSGTTYEEVESGIYAYRNYIEVEQTSPQYVKMGSTFFSQQAWQDDWTIRQRAASSGNPYLDMLVAGEY